MDYPRLIKSDAAALDRTTADMDADDHSIHIIRQSLGGLSRLSDFASNASLSYCPDRCATAPSTVSVVRFSSYAYSGICLAAVFDIDLERLAIKQQSERQQSTNAIPPAATHANGSTARSNPTSSQSRKVRAFHRVRSQSSIPIPASALTDPERVRTPRRREHWHAALCDHDEKRRKIRSKCEDERISRDPRRDH